MSSGSAWKARTHTHIHTHTHTPTSSPSISPILNPKRPPLDFPSRHDNDRLAPSRCPTLSHSLGFLQSIPDDTGRAHFPPWKGGVVGLRRLSYRSGPFVMVGGERTRPFQNLKREVPTPEEREGRRGCRVWDPPTFRLQLAERKPRRAQGPCCGRTKVGGQHLS